MSNKLKIFLGFSYLSILIIFLYILFSKIQIDRLGDFSYYKELQYYISSFIGKNLYLNLILFFWFSVFWILLLGFASPILIISGIFFGKWVGTILTVLSISLGSLFLYLIANFFFKDLVKNILHKKFLKYMMLFKKNEFTIFFIFRFSGGLGIPFGLQNILPVIFNIKISNYFFASLFGFIPSFFIWNTIGAGINNFIETSENFSFLSLLLSKEIYLPLILFVCLIAISYFIRKKFFNVKD